MNIRLLLASLIISTASFAQKDLQLIDLKGIAGEPEYVIGSDGTGVFQVRSQATGRLLVYLVGNVPTASGPYKRDGNDELDGEFVHGNQVVKIKTVKKKSGNNYLVQSFGTDCQPLSEPSSLAELPGEKTLFGMQSPNKNYLLISWYAPLDNGIQYHYRVYDKTMVMTKHGTVDIAGSKDLEVESQFISDKGLIYLTTVNYSLATESNKNALYQRHKGYNLVKISDTRNQDVAMQLETGTKAARAKITSNADGSIVCAGIYINEKSVETGVFWQVVESDFKAIIHKGQLPFAESKTALKQAKNSISLIPSTNGESTLILEQYRKGVPGKSEKDPASAFEYFGDISIYQLTNSAKVKWQQTIGKCQTMNPKREGGSYSAYVYKDHLSVLFNDLADNYTSRGLYKGDKGGYPELTETNTDLVKVWIDLSNGVPDRHVLLVTDETEILDPVQFVFNDTKHQLVFMTIRSEEEKMGILEYGSGTVLGE